jgi:hypothetical protein
MNTDITTLGFSLRWLLTFLGFPIGGALAYALIRSMDNRLVALSPEPLLVLRSG